MYFMADVKTTNSSVIFGVYSVTFLNNGIAMAFLLSCGIKYLCVYYLKIVVISV